MDRPGVPRYWQNYQVPKERIDRSGKKHSVIRWSSRAGVGVRFCMKR